MSLHNWHGKFHPTNFEGSFESEAVTLNTSLKAITSSYIAYLVLCLYLYYSNEMEATFSFSFTKDAISPICDDKYTVLVNDEQ